MSTIIVKALLKKSERNSKLHRKSLEKCDKLIKEIDAIEQKIEELYAKRNEAVCKLQLAQREVSNYDMAASRNLDMARLEYTKDMDGPSEQKREAWEKFFSENTNEN